MTVIQTDLSNLITEELCQKIDNCSQACVKLNDDCILSFCAIISEQSNFDVDKQLLLETCWNIYSWLRQSMKHLMFLSFSYSDVILVDLDRDKLYELINLLKKQLVIVYSFYPLEFIEIERYLEAFYLMAKE